MKQISSLFTINSHNTDLELFFLFLLKKNKPNATTRRKTKRTSANIYIFERKEIIKFFLLAHVRCDLILKRDFLKQTPAKKEKERKDRQKKIQKGSSFFFNTHTHQSVTHFARKNTLFAALRRLKMDGTLSSFLSVFFHSRFLSFNDILFSPLFCAS